MNYNMNSKCNCGGYCFDEYNGKTKACIRKQQPDCNSIAVIPTVTVENIADLNNLTNVFVHTLDTNTTYYFDDKGRPIITWAGAIDVPGYDIENNPNHYKNQIVTDTSSGVAAIYDAQGVGYVFGIDVAEYLNGKTIFSFDTITDLKQDESLSDGSFAITLGYHSVNDGGAGLYKITTAGTANGYNIIELDSGLIATLIADEVNLPQFGCYGDATHDDAVALNFAIGYAGENGMKIVSPANKVYLVGSSIDISNANIDLNGATIKSTSNIDIVIISTTDYYTTLKNCVIDCTDTANSAIDIVNGRKVLIEGIVINNVKLYGIKFELGYEIFVKQCHINGGNFHNYGLYCTSGDSHFKDIVIIDCETAIYNQYGHNIFDTIHAWMYRNSNMLTSKFFETDGGRPALINCTSDTYFYAVYQKDQIPHLMISNFALMYNTGLMTPEMLGNLHPYMFYFNTASGSSLTRVTTSDIRGYSNSINSLLTNQASFDGSIDNCFIENFDKTTAFATLNTTVSDVEIVAEKIVKEGNHVYANIQSKLSVTASASDQTITIGKLPFYFRSNVEMLFPAYYASSRYNIQHLTYMYVATNGNITVTIPAGVSGTTHIKSIIDFIQ